MGGAIEREIKEWVSHQREKEYIWNRNSTDKKISRLS